MKIRLDQLEEGQVLRELVTWFRVSRPSFPARLTSLRRRSRQAAQRAGVSPKDIDRLICEVRSRRARKA